MPFAFDDDAGQDVAGIPDDLGFEGLWIRGSLAHGDPLVRLKMVSTGSIHMTG